MDIIPQPVFLKKRNGSFVIAKETGISIDTGDKDLKNLARLLSERFEKAAGYKLEIIDSQAELLPKIHLCISSESVVQSTPGSAVSANNTEQYALSVDERGIEIISAGKPGLLFGIQTLFPSTRISEPAYLPFWPVFPTYFPMFLR